MTDRPHILVARSEVRFSHLGATDVYRVPKFLLDGHRTGRVDVLGARSLQFRQDVVAALKHLYGSEVVEEWQA